jgi:hypothetical protein
MTMQPTVRDQIVSRAHAGARLARFAFEGLAIAALLGALLAFLALTGCRSAGSNADAPQGLERMDDAALARFTARCADAASIAVGIALDKGGLDAEGQAMLAALLERVATGEIKPVPGGPLSSLLDDAGLTDNEVRGAFLLAEGLLLDAGVDFAGALSDRTRAVLMAVAGAVASARASP